MASEPRFQAILEHKKVNAGAQFFQTNVVYDADALDTWLNELAKRNILDKVYILVGVMPIRSLKMVQRLTEVPGVQVPERILKRMEAVGDRAEEEGINIALELVERVKSKQVVHGIQSHAGGMGVSRPPHRQRSWIEACCGSSKETTKLRAKV